MDAGLRLRALRADDLPAVLAIERDSQAYPWAEGVFRDCLGEDYASWVALDAGDVIVGFAITMLGVDEVHLLDMCVAPAARRRGVGGRLLEEIERHARDLRCDQILLEVRDSNMAARRLYERCGFVQIGTRRGYYPAPGGREDAVVLARSLSDEESGPWP